MEGRRINFVPQLRLDGLAGFDEKQGYDLSTDEMRYDSIQGSDERSLRQRGVSANVTCEGDRGRKNGGERRKRSLETVDLRKVTVIQATKRSTRNAASMKVERNLRVAAYCRVSTDDESQESSFSIQTSYYTHLIDEHEGWESAGIYADKAISGTSRRRRQRFNEMMSDAKDGKIDYVITKSLSRFARNTVDTLDCIRQLKQLNPPVGVYFEKENLDTLNAQGELILTILSAIAQEESRSISENIRWAIWKRFEAGKPMVDLKRMLGYDKGENDEWIINEEQAEIVRFIYAEYLRGESASGIARMLNEDEKKTVLGNRWRADAVLNILKNEKYVGDVHMQKTYTKDFLTHESAQNEGQTRSFYIKEHHPAIVNRDDWNQVQELFRYRKQKRELRRQELAAQIGKEVGVQNPNFMGIGQTLYCGCCGSALQRCDYSAVARNYRDERCMTKEELARGLYSEKYKFNYSLYRCKSKYARTGREKKEHGRFSDAKRTEFNEKCTSHAVLECAVEQSFMEMCYQIRQDYLQNGDESDIVRKFLGIYNEILDREATNGYALEQIELADKRIAELERSYEEVMGKLRDANLALQRARMFYTMNPLRRESELEEESEVVLYEQMAEDIRGKLAEQQKRRRENREALSEASAKRESFESFLYYLKQLPDTNRMGQSLVIHGIDIKSGRNIKTKKSRYNKKSVLEQKSISDYLDFERNLYERFIERGVVEGDTITYQTCFGVNLVSCGNLRKLDAFIGFRRCMDDGTSILMKEAWEVNHRAIQYTRKELRRSLKKEKS